MTELGPVDFVVTWVDGRDSILNERRRQYWIKEGHARKNRVPNPDPTRFANNDEIVYCLASILKNASFASRIYVITDGQDVPTHDLFNMGFTINEIKKIKKVDHRDLLGEELGEYWPIFNSYAIETLAHRIPGLSNHYIYMNDDFFIIQDTAPCDYFYDEGISIVRAQQRFYISLFHKFHRYIDIIISSKKQVRSSFTYANKNAAIESELNFFYFQLLHAPTAIYKPIITDFFKRQKESLRKNIRHRFRNFQQFDPQALFYCLAFKLKQFRINSATDEVCYIKPSQAKKLLLAIHHSESPSNRPAKYFKGKKFLCLQSLDKLGNQEEIQLKFILRSLLQRTQGLDKDA